MIPFFDLKAYNDQFKPEIDVAINAIHDSGSYILGHQVSRFEENFADYCGSDHCVGTGNGMDALLLIFKAWIEMGRIEKRDEVIVHLTGRNDGDRTR